MIAHRVIEYITQALPNWLYTAGVPGDSPQVDTNCPLPGEQWQAVAEISDVADLKLYQTRKSFLFAGFV